jgi:hypothetical protein
LDHAGSLNGREAAPRLHANLANDPPECDYHITGHSSSPFRMRSQGRRFWLGVREAIR